MYICLPSTSLVKDAPMSNNATDDFCKLSEAIVWWLWVCIAPIIIVVGLLSNMIVLTAFRYPLFIHSTTVLHLFVLAINDSIVLSIGPVRYWTLYALNYDLRTTSDIGCKLNYFIIYVSLDFSSWILVSITFERIVSVVKPWSVRTLLTIRNAVCRLVVIYIILSGINMHFLFTNGLQETEDYDDMKRIGNMTCDTLKEEYSYFEKYIFVWIDMCIVSLIPFLIMAVCNLFVVYTLRKSRKTISAYRTYKTSVMKSEELEGASCLQPNTIKDFTKGNNYNRKLSIIKGPSRRSDTSLGSTAHTQTHILPLLRCTKSEQLGGDISRTLFLMTTVFCVTTLPNSVYLIAFTFLHENSRCSRTNAIMDVIWTLSALLVYVNCGANFFLYVARSRDFRREVKRLVVINKARLQRICSSRLRKRDKIHDMTIR